jgi:hypothetical protein
VCSSDLFDVICNRFASAQFVADLLVDDFKHVVEGIRGSFSLSPCLVQFLIGHLIAMLDAKLANKILANPERFLFGNAIAWNSFISAVELIDGMELKLAKQVAYAILMAKNLTMAEMIDEIVESVCPDLDPKVVFYLLNNLKTDELMPEPVDAGVFGAHFGLVDVSSVQAIAPRPLANFRVASGAFNLRTWNQVVLPPQVSRRYPFLNTHISAPA